MFAHSCVLLTRRLSLQLNSKETAEEVELKLSMGFVPNVLNEAKMFEWAGISLGEETWFLISKAVKVF